MSIKYYKNENGPMIAVHKRGVIEQDGCYFRDMEEVERHFEDMPFDMRAYTDTNGNCYDFGFGLDWNGVINDERHMRYIKREV